MQNIVMPQCIVYKNTKTIIQKIESLSQYRKNGANHNIADCNLTNKKLKEIRQKKKEKKNQEELLLLVILRMSKSCATKTRK